MLYPSAAASSVVADAKHARPMIGATSTKTSTISSAEAPAAIAASTHPRYELGPPPVATTAATTTIARVFRSVSAERRWLDSSGASVGIRPWITSERRTATAAASSPVPDSAITRIRVARRRFQGRTQSRRRPCSLAQCRSPEPERSAPPPRPLDLRFSVEICRHAPLVRLRCGLRGDATCQPHGRLGFVPSSGVHVAGDGHGEHRSEHSFVVHRQATQQFLDGELRNCCPDQGTQACCRGAQRGRHVSPVV